MKCFPIAHQHFQLPRVSGRPLKAHPGGVHSILLLPLVARCLETIDVCIWHMFVFMSVAVTVLGVCVNVCCVAAVVKNSGFF